MKSLGEGNFPFIFCLLQKKSPELFPPLIERPILSNSLFTSLFNHKKNEIDAAFKVAKFCSRNDGYKLLAYPKTTEYSKLLIIIPRAVGKACIRNRLRRQIKALFYEEKYFESNPHSFLLLCYKTILNYTFEDLNMLLKGTKRA